MNNDSDDKRIEELIDAVMRVSQGDFDVQLKLSPDNNNLDALAIGINMMVDDLKKGHKMELENEEIKQLNLQLQEANKKVQESDRLKTVFLQNMSHEIRTPLNAIIGFSDILADSFDNKAKLEQFSSIIKQRGIDLLDLINDLLDLSRIETGQLPINVEECNLPELFNDLQLFFTNHSQKIEKSHIKLQTTLLITPEHNLIQIDKAKIKQIFVNLIYNALKFTNQGKIEFGCTVNEHNILEFFVSDTGIGIPAEKQTIVFDRFVQLEQNTSNFQKGTGLGLSIVKGLIELLGGKISLESEVSKGSTFRFTIPYELTNRLSNNEAFKELSTDINWNQYTLLIVEDDEYNALYLEEVLLETQIKIVKVSDAFQAIDIIRSNQPVDIILMDIKLPRLNGFEAIKMIKEIRPQIKIIVQSAYASNEDKLRAENLGCNNYICKPIERELLLNMINEAL